MKIYFGGPDKPPYHLRNLLAEKSLQSTQVVRFSGLLTISEILSGWKLIEAADRGVKVSVVLEAKPRVEFANDEVYNFLKNSNKIYIHYITHRKSHKKLQESYQKFMKNLLF